jgi:hypothetical protein
VIGTLDGTLPTSVRIWPIVCDGRIEWLGRTEGIPGGRVDEHSPVAADILIVQSLLAGVVAEKLFDPDARSGSSTIEIASAVGVNRMIAIKIGCPPLTVWQVILGDLRDQLLQHREIVFAIADDLMRAHGVKGPRLKEVLRLIWRAG